MPLEITPPVASGTTTTTEVPLYWAEYGPEDAARLLILHGGPGAHHDYLLPQYLRLAQSRRLVFYDQRGGGRSRGDSSDAITWRHQVADVAGVAAERGVEPLDILGYSWGALLALLYTIESESGHLTRPRRLVLVNPAPLTRAHRGTFERAFQARQGDPAITKAREELAASDLRERDPEAYRQRAFELSVSGYFARPESASELTPFRVMGRTQESIWRSLGDFDVIARLRGVAVPPALVIHGWHDPIDVQSSYEGARALGARFVVLEASGHVPHVEQPDELFATIERFLADTDQTVAPTGQ
jgi:proline iminopeptidase